MTKRSIISLKRLLAFQVIFLVCAVSYLLVSLWMEKNTGKALSAVAIIPSILMFVGYGLSLFLSKLTKHIWYRLAMVVAIVLFGGGGVIGNIVKYINTGLEFYFSMGTWILAVSINAFGTIFNIIAVLGLYKKG